MGRSYGSDPLFPTVPCMRVSLHLLCAVVLISVAGLKEYDTTAKDNSTQPMVVINVCGNWCGMGNQMFRYAAGLGMQSVQNHSRVCVLGFGEAEWHFAHARSVMAMHVDVLVPALPLCPSYMKRFSWLKLDSELKDRPDAVFRPPHSIYEPVDLDLPESSVMLVDGCMQSFKYFMHLPQPFFRLKQQENARKWLDAHRIGTVVHVRRQDKLLDGSSVAPIEFYEEALGRLGHPPRLAVCTDDPLWVKEQRVFRRAVVSVHHDPGFDMALLAAATDAVIIGIGTFGWWGAYLSSAKYKYFYRTQYHGRLASGYREEDYIPYGLPGQGEWVAL